MELYSVHVYLVPVCKSLQMESKTKCTFLLIVEMEMKIFTYFYLYITQNVKQITANIYYFTLQV